MAETISETPIEQFLTAWFQALDRHAPLEEVSSFLTDNDLEIAFLQEDLAYS